MKKLLGISLVAMMAVTSANAEIASKAYVDQRETAANDYTDTKIGTLPGNAENVGAAIGNLGDSTTVAAAIAAAVSEGVDNAVTHTGAVGNATTPVYVTEAGVATAGTALGTMAYEAAENYTKSADLGAAASKGVATTVAENETDLPTAGAVYTYVNTQSAASNFVEDSVNSASTAKAPSGHAVSEALALKADSEDLGDLAALDEVAESNLASALATKINAKADATALDSYELKANVTSKGSATNPVYFDANGVATPITSYPAANVTGLGTAASANVAKNGVAADETGLVTGAQVQTAISTASAPSNFISQTITDAVTDKAPSSDAVFDALAEKQGLIGSTTDNDGQYVLTADLVSGSMTNYRWELVQRATAGENQGQ